MATSSTGMAGKDALDSDVLGGASDYFADIITQLRKLFTGPDEEKVSIGNLINIVWNANCGCTCVSAIIYYFWSTEINKLDHLYDSLIPDLSTYHHHSAR